MTIVRKVTDTGKIMAKEKDITCTLVVENDQPLMVLADQARTEQVLYNLMGNAIKFTKEGGVTIDVKLGENNTVRIRVIDSGAGIPLENHGLLFRKFQQAGKSVFTREASEGSGMGLYISSLLAQGMHGTIKLESSELGKGSVFVFELPKT
jgi:signal transduction histidine kinase